MTTNIVYAVLFLIQQSYIHVVLEGVYQRAFKGGLINLVSVKFNIWLPM